MRDGLVSGLPYDETLNRFLEAAHYFEKQLTRFEAMKMPAPDNGLDSFQWKKNKQ